VVLLAFVELDRAIEFIGDLIPHLGPHVDDLLLTFAVGDDAVAVLLLDDFDFLVGEASASFLASGIIMSVIPMEMPEREASRKPSCFRRSRALTVSF